MPYINGKNPPQNTALAKKGKYYCEILHYILKWFYLFLLFVQVAQVYLYNIEDSRAFQENLTKFSLIDFDKENFDSVNAALETV